jgi:hypothetical protein
VIRDHALQTNRNINAFLLEKTSIMKKPILYLLIIFLLVGSLLSSAFPEEPKVETPKPEGSAFLEEKWGVKVVGVRLTANNYMLDFRYRVTDPDKAWLLLQKKTERYLIQQATGKKFRVPRTRLGPLRQSAVKPATDRDYIIIFANEGQAINAGDKVTVVMGDFKAEDLVVE